MVAATRENQSSIHIERNVVIEAPIKIAFEALLEQLGPASSMPDGTPLPMTLEPRPGGRWFRDLGDDTGHLWGTVQVIKPPKLIEISGPLFMSYPALSHLQYRLVEQGASTLLEFTYRTHRAEVEKSWG